MFYNKMKLCKNILYIYKKKSSKKFKKKKKLITR